MPAAATRLIRGLLALVALAAIVVGIPALLIAAAGWPLPADWPSIDEIKVALQQGNIPGKVVVDVIAVIAWLVWAQCTWAVGWECAVNVRRVAAGRTSAPAPMVPRSLGVGLGRLVTLVLALGSMNLSVSSTVVALPTPTVASPETPTSSPRADPTSSATPESRCHALYWVVKRGDSLWRIAEVALGDGARVDQLLELNPQISSPRTLQVGQQLTLPYDAVVPDDRLPVARKPDLEYPLRATYVAPVNVVVEPGDTLWNLANARLREASADASIEPQAIADYVDQIVAANPDTIEDADLIYPGEAIEFPAIGTPPPEPNVVEHAPGEASETEGSANEETAPNPAPAVPVSRAGPASLEPTDTPPTPAATDRPPATDSTTPNTLPTPPEPNYDNAAIHAPAVDDENKPGLHAPFLAGISGSTVLASALLVAYRRRRRRQARRGAAALRRGAPVRRDRIDALVAAADLTLVGWAARELADLFASLQPGDVTGTPIAAELSELHGLELLWSHRNVDAPRPWEAFDGGWSWRLAYDPDALVAADLDAAPPLPALVTIGSREGNQLLLNLEAIGSIAVAGDPVLAESLVRSIVIELAASDQLADTFVHSVGFGTVTDPHFGRITHTDETAALAHLRAVVADHASVLDTAALDSSFALRLGGDATGRESTLLVLHAEMVEEAVAFALAATPDRGASVIVLGSCDEATATITVSADRSATLDHLDLQFLAAGVPAETADRIADLLHESCEPIAVEEMAVEQLSFGETPDGTDDAYWNRPQDVLDVETGDEQNGEPNERPENVGELPEVRVRVLGIPRVEGFEHLGRLETNIVTYLACKGGKSTRDQLVNAVWGGRLVSDKAVNNRISRARAALRVYLPSRTRSSDAIVLHSAVTTDLVLLERAIREAATRSSSEAINSLSDGLELIEGVPFDAADYDWAHEQQFVAAASELIEAAALRLVELCLDTGEIGVARRGITQGIRALPGNEPLYRARMKLEHAAGNTDGVKAAFDELRSVLSGGPDDGFEFEPSQETVQLHQSLVRSTYTVAR